MNLIRDLPPNNFSNRFADGVHSQLGKPGLATNCRGTRGDFPLFLPCRVGRHGGIEACSNLYKHAGGTSRYDICGTKVPFTLTTRIPQSGQHCSNVLPTYALKVGRL
jgi:hypothetical protein